MPLLSLSDVTLYYEMHGTGPPLLFIHGLGSSNRDWYRQVDHFTRNYQVITVDLRGHGRASKPAGPYTIPQMADDLADLLETLNVPSAHVVGLSMGAMVALQLALDHPEHVQTVTAANCDVDYRLLTFRDWLIYVTRYLLVQLLGPYALAVLLAPRLLPDPEQADLRETFIHRYSQNDREALLSSIDAIAGWSIADRLGEISQPALIVAAEHDYSPVSTKKAYVAEITRAELAVISDTHHAVPVEKPGCFNEILESFLARHAHVEPAVTGR